jgi:hypothetical protein
MMKKTIEVRNENKNVNEVIIQTPNMIRYISITFYSVSKNTSRKQE